jgi:hypothetical protein
MFDARNDKRMLYDDRRERVERGDSKIALKKAKVNGKQRSRKAIIGIKDHAKNALTTYFSRAYHLLVHSSC